MSLFDITTQYPATGPRHSILSGLVEQVMSRLARAHDAIVEDSNPLRTAQRQADERAYLKDIDIQVGF